MFMGFDGFFLSAFSDGPLFRTVGPRFFQTLHLSGKTHSDPSFRRSSVFRQARQIRGQTRFSALGPHVQAETQTHIEAFSASRGLPFLKDTFAQIFRVYGRL